MARPRKIVQDYPTSKEALQFAGLDYTVEKFTLFAYDTSGAYSEEPLFDESQNTWYCLRKSIQYELNNKIAKMRNDLPISLHVYSVL